LEDLGIDWRIILKWIIMKQDGVVDWIYLTQDREELLASKGGLCAM